MYLLRIYLLDVSTEDLLTGGISSTTPAADSSSGAVLTTALAEDTVGKTIWEELDILVIVFWTLTGVPVCVPEGGCAAETWIWKNRHPTP
jgi:hypothetical protein